MVTMAQRVCLIAVLMTIALLGSQSASAGKFNEVLSIGDAAPQWNNLPGTDGKSHSLSDLADKPVVVVVFTCVSCPTAADYEDRINALAQKDPENVAVVAICVNQVAEDRLEKLTERAAEKKFQFQYLHDESQAIARAYGAVFTPEFYVLDRNRKVVYMGAMDDATDPTQVKIRYVDDAVAAALKGVAPETSETIARGCRVRYARERRKS
jgi:peroxiredoxin